MTGSHGVGVDGIEGKCRLYKAHDSCRVQMMHYLSYNSRQQQHLLQWLQTLGA